VHSTQETRIGIYGQLEIREPVCSIGAFLLCFLEKPDFKGWAGLLPGMTSLSPFENNVAVAGRNKESSDIRQ
jgi:hypothetical protein